MALDAVLAEFSAVTSFRGTWVRDGIGMICTRKFGRGNSSSCLEDS